MGWGFQRAGVFFPSVYWCGDTKYPRRLAHWRSAQTCRRPTPNGWYIFHRVSNYNGRIRQQRNEEKKRENRSICMKLRSLLITIQTVATAIVQLSVTWAKPPLQHIHRKWFNQWTMAVLVVPLILVHLKRGEYWLRWIMLFLLLCCNGNGSTNITWLDGGWRWMAVFHSIPFLECR